MKVELVGNFERPKNRRKKAEIFLKRNEDNTGEMDIFKECQ